MLNKVELIGRVGQTPTIRMVGDQKVASFTLATNEVYKGKDGNYVSNTEWHNIEAWGNIAERAEKIVNKGGLYRVEGKIKYEKYKGNDGVEKIAVKIRINELLSLEKKSEDASPAQEEPKRFDPRAVKTTPIVDDLPEDDTELPF